VPHTTPRRPEHDDALEGVLDRREITQAVAFRSEHQQSETELRNRPALDRDAVVAVVGHPKVAEFLLGVTARSLGPVAVDPVAVQVQRHAVGADQNAVVRAVDEIAV
jgi:hypothetical protein